MRKKRAQRILPAVKERVYTVTEVDGAGGCGAYTPEFELLNTVTEEGAPLCYVAVDEPRQLVYGASIIKVK